MTKHDEADEPADSAAVTALENMTRRLVPALATLALILPLPAAPAAAQQEDDPVPPEHEGHIPDDEAPFAATEGTGFPGFNESAGCGPPATANPLATRMGSLSSSERIRGYRGDFFGRTVSQIASQLVSWTVPLSGGKVVKVHRRALPAFRKAGANLVAAAAANPNQPYFIRSSDTATYVPRTVGGSYSISNHTFGATIDINWNTNPYRSDARLITDMPEWFVQAWRDAGFCWGGDWIDIKDPMHFSWQGPNATPGYGAVPKPFPPATSHAAFGTKAAEFYVAPLGPSRAGRPRIMADLTGNGLADVAEATDIAGGISIRYSRTNRLHNSCAAASFAVPGVARKQRTLAFADYERHGRNDVWLIDTSESKVVMYVALRSTHFKKRIKLNTAAAPSAGAGYLLADHDRDGIQDLYVVRRTAAATRVEVWDGSSGYAKRTVNATTPLGDTRGAALAIGDRNLDDLPDLYVVDGASLRILYHGYTSVDGSATLPVSSAWADVAINDYDGDGRDDLFLLRSSGMLEVYLGNTPLPGASLTSWFVPPGWTCSDPPDDTYNGWCDISLATHVGTDGNDVIRGTPGQDVIFGGRGNDVIYGGGGDDVICGGSGNDTIYGGPGVDRVFAGKGDDTVDGGNGGDFLFGESGNDTLRGGAGKDHLGGGLGDDALRGGGGDDTADGGAGDDRMWGDGGHDVFHGGDGRDVAFGGSGNDVLMGEDGPDRLNGGTGNDILRGGRGEDRLSGGGAADTLDGGAGDDVLIGGNGHDTIVGRTGDDRLGGGAGHDRLVGSAGHDRLWGHQGNDRLDGGPGSDVCQGGPGTDIAAACETVTGVP